MRFTAGAAVTRRDTTVPSVGIREISDGDPLQLKGARVILSRSDREPTGLVVGTTTSYGASKNEARAFVKLDTGCTAWFAIDDLEPADEIPVSTPSLELPGFVDFWG